MSELLPCPFCGGEAHTYKNNLWHVACERAHNGCVTMSSFITEAEAIAAWNTRADYHGYEQAAIEAWESIKAWNTRVERTCKVEGDYWHDHGGDGSDTYEFVLSCGHKVEWLDDAEKPRYCPRCGARIEVGE